MTSAPQPSLGNRSLLLPAGKVIGGGSTINGMVFNRGSKADYYRWEELGNPGWNFDDLLSYFKKAEISTPPTTNLEVEGWEVGYNTAFHGDAGNVHASFATFVWPSTSESICSVGKLHQS